MKVLMLNGSPTPKGSNTLIALNEMKKVFEAQDIEVTFNPIVEFIISLVIGALLYWIGRGAWKLLVLYCKKISRTASHLSI